MAAHRLEVADVFREHAAAYLSENGISVDQRRVLRAIAVCRTAALGGHVTRSTGGNIWFGPSVKYQERKDDYENDRLPVEDFAAAARELLPMLTVADLRLSGSGIRPKLHPASESFADFMIKRDTQNPRVVHAAGIESPGLTSCLSVGRTVDGLVSSTTTTY